MISCPSTETMNCHSVLRQKHENEYIALPYRSTPSFFQIEVETCTFLQLLMWVNLFFKPFSLKLNAFQAQRLEVTFYNTCPEYRNT